MIDEQIALLRARGSGAVEPPRDPLAFVHLATRYRALLEEMHSMLTEDAELLDAEQLWAQLKKYTNSVAPVRFVTLRNVRAAVKEVAVPEQCETDLDMMTALEALIAVRACRSALEAAAEPARRWFGELAPEPFGIKGSRCRGSRRRSRGPSSCARRSTRSTWSAATPGATPRGARSSRSSARPRGPPGPQPSLWRTASRCCSRRRAPKPISRCSRGSRPR
jgi:hypothetical protein